MWKRGIPEILEADKAVGPGDYEELDDFDEVEELAELVQLADSVQAVPAVPLGHCLQ